MHEFEIIERFFNRPVKNPGRFPLGVGDDAALMSVPQGYELATSIDTLVAGVHFPIPSDAGDIGYKSLAVSLSDMAAMGAEPIAVLLALTLPESDRAWLKKFASEFFRLADQFQVELLGGNITRGPLSVSTVTYGLVPAGKALRRSGAKPGDDIYVTGDLGEAGFALQELNSTQDTLEPALHRRFFRPMPRVRVGMALREVCTAAIDVSDGLAADLEKLLTASHAGGEIQTPCLPLSEVMRRKCRAEQAVTLALAGGEDYELCFTTPRVTRGEIEKILAPLECTAHWLGTVTVQSGLKIFGADGQPFPLSTRGFQHF